MLENNDNAAGGRAVTMRSTPEEKIRLFRALFRGRDDVYASRWESKSGKSGYSPSCSNEWIRGVCEKAKFRSGVKVGCDKCPNRSFVPVDDRAVANHLRGIDEKGKQFVMGIYPLLDNDTVSFAAVDFDKASWRADVSSVVQTLRELGLPVAVERSRSGNGAHIWFFFDEALPAGHVRDVLSFVLTLTMERNPSMGLDSYDRIFPNQSRVPKGGFGNLIALPLQGAARKVGNSVFVDDRLVPFPDQWKFLSELAFTPKSKMTELLARARSEKRILAPQREEEIEKNEPWSLFTPQSDSQTPCDEPVEGELHITLGNAIYIAQENIPPTLRGRLIRLPAFANPAFRDAERLRLSVYNIPRVICRAIDGENHLVLPRGCLEDVLATLRRAKASWTMDDKRVAGNPIDVSFDGELRPEQNAALKAILAHDTGVLAAGTAFGKTVVAAAVIARRKVNTLILVNRKPLADQWAERLSQFLGIPKKEIGIWGGGKHRFSGKIDIALIQSLTRKGQTNREITGTYGQLIVDECHGISAPSFERVASAFAGRYALGLSATVVRKDGHHPIIHMQLGPVRHRVEAREMSVFQHFAHTVEVRLTGFEPTVTQSATQPEDTTSPDAADSDESRPAYAELVSELANDIRRNEMIVKDVVDAVAKGRSPVVLTERRDHLETLREMMSGKVENILVFHGQMGARQQRELDAARAAIPDDKPRVLLATGSFIGEGFDDARLDTLFLTLPISWKGRLTQYAGRLHRQHAGKRDVVIYDYADTNVALFARMFNRRCAGYKSIGYDVRMPVSTASGLPSNVSLLRERKLDEAYSESVRRLLREGVSAEEIDLFASAAESIKEESDELARSSVERFLFKHLDAMPQTKGVFELNGRLDIPFGTNRDMEVDLLSRSCRLAVEIDGWRHFGDREAYRRDRRKDELLQANGYFVLRFLAEDVISRLGDVFARIVRRLNHKLDVHSEAQ